MENCKPMNKYKYVTNRPMIHFSPEQGWMNDPNGMFYFDGEYHLFFQYTPGEISHPGPKHWGHAVSKDLVHWQHLPIALFPDSLGEIWSGSAVVDWGNTSNQQVGEKPVVVAIFTQYDDGLQQQSIAFSNDRGRSWEKYAGNPVIPNPGLNDFRDPKVFWHEGTCRWIMVLAAGDRVMIYTSHNLIDWKYASEFGALEGSHSGVWECPDLFPLSIRNHPEQERWVLLVSIGSGAPNGGSGTQYFMGDFNGENFTNHNPASNINWVDYGKDNYAGVTFSGVQNRRIFIGWMNNWYYAYEIPTQPWRGTMTFPRELGLVYHQGNTPMLVSSPVPELRILREKHTRITNQFLENEERQTILNGLNGSPVEIEIAIQIETAQRINFVINFGNHESVYVGYDVLAGKLYIDRRESGLVDFKPSFGDQIHGAPLGLEDSNLTLRMVIDASSIELFANEGCVVMTDLLFPRGLIDNIEVYTLGGNAIIHAMDAWILSTIWGD